jgi:hypothetical protein
MRHDLARALFGLSSLALVGALVAAPGHARADDPPPAPRSVKLPVCGANEALGVRPDGTYACRTLPSIPSPLPADCSLGPGDDDAAATCVPRGTGQTDAYYLVRKDAIVRWLDAGGAARTIAELPKPQRTFECGTFTKVSPEVFRCETAASKDGPPALPTPKCGPGQTVTFNAQRELRCMDLPSGRVALPCSDFASGQTSRDGVTIECGPRNAGAVDEGLLARTLDYVYRVIEGKPPRELARPLKASLRTGRIPMCGDAQTLVWRDGALTCATRGAAAITRTDATILKGILERVITRLQRSSPVVDPFLPPAKLGDSPAVLFLDKR